MGIITDILKNIPLNAVLRERIRDLESQVSILQQENMELVAEKTKSQSIILDLTEKNNEQQKQIAEQATKISIPAKFNFDPLVGCLVSISESKRYCTACLLKFKESPLGFKGNPLICPECKTDYNGPSRFIAVHQVIPDDPFSRI